MPVNFSDAIAAYAHAGRMGNNPGQGAAASSGGNSFGDLVKGAAENLVDNLNQGEQATMQAVTGKADLVQVSQAISNAEVALQTATAVRDKIVQAYQSIMQMPI